jgi:hypothetical protein
MGKKQVSNMVISPVSYIWKVTASHTAAYFLAGIFAYIFMNYRAAFGSDALSCYMRPVDSPWTAIGPALQLLRGVLIALILLPFRKTLFEEKWGGLKLALLIFGLSFLSTIGPTPGSFEGFIYTKLGIGYQLLGYPEALIYVAVFSSASVAWYRHPKKVFNVISAVVIALILLMSYMGYLQSTGKLQVGTTMQAQSGK